MANTSVHEQNTNENTESRFINDDPKLPDIFPEELAGWHKYVQIKELYCFIDLSVCFSIIVTSNGKNILTVVKKQMKF